MLFNVLWLLLENRERLDDNLVFFREIVESANEECLEMLVEQTVEHLQTDDYDEKEFINNVFSDLVKKLHECKMHSNICKIANFFSDNKLVECGCAFVCAYAYGKSNNARTSAGPVKIYAQNCLQAPAE